MSLPSRLLTAAAAALLIVGAALSALAAPNFPELTGRIVDQAGLINAEDRAAIEADLAALEQKSTDQLTVVTLKSLDGYDIADYGYQLGRHWGIGQAGKNNGVLLIVAPNDRKVRVEVGRGLEPVVTDALSSVVVNNALLPAFRRGDFSGGIRAAVRDLKDIMLGDAEAVRDRSRVPEPEIDWFALMLIAFWIAILIYVLYAQYRQAQSMPAGMRRSRRRFDDRYGGPIFIPGGDSGSWSGGSWGGGGGGWSGGGGDFGGGGASGSW